MFNVFIPQNIEEKVAGIIKRKKLPFAIKPLMEEIKQELHKLGENPNLGKMATENIFEGHMYYSFKILRLPLVFQFSVTYKFTPDDQAILITRIVQTIGDPPKRLPEPSWEDFVDDDLPY